MCERRVLVVTVWEVVPVLSVVVAVMVPVGVMVVVAVMVPVGVMVVVAVMVLVGVMVVVAVCVMAVDWSTRSSFRTTQLVPADRPKCIEVIALGRKLPVPWIMGTSSW
jgi:hypothetical protein